MAEAARPARSYLYVPGSAREKLARAGDRGADALILDLEDAVAVDEKAAARSAVIRWLEAGGAGPTPAWVRVNAGGRGEEDLRAVAAAPGLAGVVLPKVADAGLVRRARDLVAETGPVLMPLIETAAGVLDARAIAAEPGVWQLQLGEVDLAAELHLEPDPDETELAGPRIQVVLASAAAGIAPPLGPVHAAFRDLGSLERSTRRLRRLGFFGRACIHPAQVPLVNRAFTPDAAEVEAAREVLRLLAEAEGRGEGVVVDRDGRMLDSAHVRQARWTVALAQE